MNSLYHRKMPARVDRRIKRSLWMRIARVFADDYLFSRPTFAVGMAVFALLFTNSQSQFYEIKNQNQLYAAVLDNMTTERTQDQNSIVHMKMRVAEGRDKAVVVARLNEIDPQITAQVPQRSEEVELWQHGTNIMTVVRSDLPQQPTQAFMNLERDDHVHVLRYAPESCVREDPTLQSPGCKQEKTLNDEQQAHRTLFDGVHNITSDYQNALSVHTKPFRVQDLEPMQFDRIEQSHIVLQSQSQENLKREYRFDKNTLQLASVHTFLSLEGTWYEMSVIEYALKENIEAQKLDEIFDPEKYPLEQTDLIELI